MGLPFSFQTFLIQALPQQKILINNTLPLDTESRSPANTPNHPTSYHFKLTVRYLPQVDVAGCWGYSIFATLFF